MMIVDRKFQRGGKQYSICNDEKENNVFILKKDGKYFAELIGYYGGTHWSEGNYRFDSICPTCTFYDPLDRIAISDAIACLEEIYNKTL